MQFGKDFDHWPTILGGPMVKILGGGGNGQNFGGAKRYSGPPTQIFGGAMAPLAPPVPPPLHLILGTVFKLFCR